MSAIPRTPAIGVVLPRDLPAPQVREYVLSAERLGFDELWVVEDLGFRGGIAQAALALSITQRIRIGIGILPAAARNVHFAAMEVATLAQLFPGRLAVGVGHGMPEWMQLAGCWPDRPLTFLGDYTRDLRALLTGGASSAGVRLEPCALPEVVPPLLLGVRGPKSLAVAGQVADGTALAEPSTPEYVRAAQEQIAAAGDHAIVTYNAAAVDDDGDRALELVRPGLAWIGESDWAVHLVGLPFAAELAELRAQCAGPEEFAARLPAEWIPRLALAGTPEAVRPRIAELGRAGVTSSLMFPSGPDPIAALGALARVL